MGFDELLRRHMWVEFVTKTVALWCTNTIGLDLYEYVWDSQGVPESPQVIDASLVLMALNVSGGKKVH
jgi:hypothetical protein